MSTPLSSPQAHQSILLESGTNEVEFLEFVVSQQRFGINVAKVVQAMVWTPSHLTRIPGSGGSVLGTVLFRDQTVVTVDLTLFLELEASPCELDRRLLLVTEFNQKTFAFVIDGIEGVRRVSWEEFAPLDSVGIASVPCVTGTVTVDDRLVLILDVEAMMAMIDPDMRIESYESEIPAHPGHGRPQLRIVYAEDSPMIQKVTLKVLHEAGFDHVKVFSSGAQALAYITSESREDIDVIISDIEMPEMDGLTLCRNVRDLPKMAASPFLFYSSLISESMQKKCASVGATACFSKPEVHHLIKRLDTLLDPAEAI